MALFIDLWLWTHIAAGFTAFFVAPAALLTRKGGKAHRKWGKIYFWAMAVVAFSACIVAAYRPNLFLFLVAIFSFYLAFTGYRVLGRKRPAKGQKAAPLDWVVSIICLLACIALVVLGIKKIIGPHGGFGLVYMVFGLFGGGAAAFDLRKFVRPPKDKNSWFFDHMGGMMGSYIAALTAFSAVNLEFLPILVRWLWPTIVGGIGITVWSRYYRTKFATTRNPKGVQAV